MGWDDYQGPVQGREATEAAYNLAQAARSKQLVTGRNAPVYSAQEIANAKAILPQITGTFMPLSEAYKAQQSASMAAAIRQAESQGMTMNGFPVIVQNGSLVYDIDKIGAAMGLSSEEIKGARVNLGTRSLKDPSKALDDLSGKQTYSGGVGDNEALRRDQWNRGVSSLSNPQSVLNNLLQVSPLEKIDFTNPDVQMNLAKAGYATDIESGKSMKSVLNRTQAPTGMGKYAGPAMKAAVGAMLTLATAGAASPILAGALTGAGYGALTTAAGGGTKLNDILKGAAMGGGTAALGGVAKGVGNFVGEATQSAGTLVSSGAKAAATGLATGLGKEGLESLVLGEKFNLGDVAKTSATSAGIAGAKIAGNAFLESDLGKQVSSLFSNEDAVSDAVVPDTFGDATGGEETLPGTLSVGSVPTSSYTPLSIGLPMIGETEILPGRLSFPSVANQGVFENMQGQFGGDTGMEGTGTITTDTPIYPDNPSPGTETQSGMSPGTRGNLGLPDEDLIVNQNSRAYPDSPTPGTETPSGMSPGTLGNLGLPGEDLIVNQNESLNSYSPSLGDVGGAVLGPVIQSMLDTYQGSQSSRQSGGAGTTQALQRSTAGQYDPTSELQAISTGLTQVNPALSEFMEFSIDPEEEKKRKQLWMQNPVIEP